MSQIYSAISAVMAEIDPIGKTRKNEQQGYKFRGIDDVYLAVNEPFVKHGIFCVPTVLSSVREERQTAKGGTLLYTILTVKYTFYAKDGSFVESTVCGEAMDSGDKSANKAMSAAMKYALMQIFAIPTEEPKDTEYHSPEPLPKHHEKKDTLLINNNRSTLPTYEGLLSLLPQIKDGTIATVVRSFLDTNKNDLAQLEKAEARIKKIIEAQK